MITLEVPIHNAIIRIAPDSAIPEAPHAFTILPRTCPEHESLARTIDCFFMTSEEARDVGRALLLAAGERP